MPIVLPSASPTGASCTLAGIEQEVAPRCGPYELRTVAAGNVAWLQVNGLISTLGLGGYADLWILRRGYKTDGTAVVGFDTRDRQRRITAEPAVSSGRLIPDQAWYAAPVADEQIELHYLDPEQELRPAVQRGLWRCYFLDRAAATLAGTAAERDLTDAVPWITKWTQVYEVASLFGVTGIRPYPLDWFESFVSGGHVWLGGWPDPYPATLYVTGIRPAATLVNGAYSATGPVNDTDTVPVDLFYAAAAGHIEAWRRVRHRLAPAAATGMHVSQEEAAAEFTRQSVAHVKPRPDVEHTAYPFAPASYASLP